MRTSYPALLLMESHGLAPNVRSTTFDSIELRSMLYLAGPYYVDLNLVPDGQGVEVRGQILTDSDDPLPTPGSATALDRSGSVMTTVSMSPEAGGTCAGFTFHIDDIDELHLQLDVGVETLDVTGIDLR